MDNAALAEQEKNPDGALHIGKPLTKANMTMATGGNDAWVPDVLKGLHALPENGGTFGTPWLLRTVAAQHRTGATLIPLWGVGHFVIGITGYAWLVQFPGQCVIDLGEPMENGWEVIGALPKADFGTFFNKKVFHSLVCPGSIAWVPYGHLDSLITLSGGAADYIVLPFCSMPLLNHMPMPVRAAVLATFQRYLHSCNVAKHVLWKTIGPAFVTWFGHGLPDPASEAGEEEDMSGTE